MPAESFESRNRVLDHGDIVGAQDGLDDGQDRWGVDQEVAWELLDERGKDLEGNLDISGN